VSCVHIFLFVPVPLFPYTLDNGDTELKQSSTRCSGAVEVPLGLPAFGQTYKHIFVCSVL